MSLTLADLQARIGSFLDSNPSGPASSSLQWQRRQTFINQGIRIWSETRNWRSLYKEYNALVSAPSGVSTHALPSDFRKLDGNAIIGGYKFTDVFPHQKPDIAATSYITYLMGTPGAYSLIMKWDQGLDNLVSMTVPYYKVPVSLTTPGAVSEIPDPEFLVAKAQAMELRSLVKDHESANSEDARAELILRRMIDSENTLPYANDRTILTPEDRRGFRIGED